MISDENHQGNVEGKHHERHGANSNICRNTTQGGVISPMLANVALTCLDELTLEYAIGKGSNPIVRYADDFIITVKSEEKALAIKSHIKEYLKDATNLTLSDDKTRITEISEGFDFLGFNTRKYKDKLLIKPSKANVEKFKLNVKKVIKITDDPIELIHKLNPIIRGWGNYYRHVVSKDTFDYLGKILWQNTSKWCRKRHPRGNGHWIKQYYKMDRGNRWRFSYEGAIMDNIYSIPIRRFIKVRSDKRVYDASDKEYWDTREYVNAKNSIYGSIETKTLFYKQRGKCGYCVHPITDTQVRDNTIYKHHMKPRSENGDWKLGNLRLLHADCHTSLHSMYSRKEMADLMDKGIDYLRLMKPAK